MTGSVALASALLETGRAAGAAPPPNVVFVLADDLRPDGIAALGNPNVKTPHFDAVVDRGVSFRKAYTMGSMVGAVCLPSRTMVLTGRSLFRAANAPSGEDPGTHTFPRVMRESGYVTLHAGKFGNSPKHITDEFDETVDPGDATAVADAVVRFVGRHAGKQPFLAYMAGREPHDPQYAPQRFYDMYDPKVIPLPAAFVPYHPFDNGEMTVRDEMTLPFPRSPEEIRGKLARYYASISYLDHEFGRVVQALKEAGQYENTLFIIAGDNGLSLGEHGLLGKQNLYEYGGMHVPLVFAGPGIRRGETGTLTYLMDIFPTVCDLVGAPIPSGVEGLSLAAILRGRADRVRAWLFTAYSRVQRAVTDGRWKLIRYPQIDKTQLFDLDRDPHEQCDLSDDPRYAEQVQFMLDRLAELQRVYGDDLPLHVAEPLSAAWSPEKLTPEQLAYQKEETDHCKGLTR